MTAPTTTRRRDDLRTKIPGWWYAKDVEPSEIVQWVKERQWKDWHDAYRPWWRQVEDNVRMLSGRQWDVYINAVGDFVDVSRYFPVIEDQQWRENPVFNWVAHYYKLTLSKLTENPPGIGYLPSTPDEIDARLAQVMEPVFKSTWRRMDMPEACFDLYGWVIASARGIAKLKWDPDLGPAEDYQGPSVISLLTGDGIFRRELSNAPYLHLGDGDFMPHVLNDLAMDNGQPMVDPQTGLPVFLPADDGDPTGLKFGPPSRDRLGDLDTEIVPSVAVIAPHGPLPFHKKPWYTHVYPMHVDEIQQRWGVEIAPDELTFDDVLELKLQYGTHYGMPGRGSGALGITRLSEVSLRDMALVYEHWHRDMPGHEILSRGRLAIVAGDEVCYDDINPYWVENVHEEVVMPFEAFDLVKYPFRQEGTADLEILSPLNRAINRRMGGAMDAVDFNEQPLLLKKRQAAIDEDINLNAPGTTVEYTDTNGRPPLERMAAGELPKSSIDLATTLQNWMQMLGSQPLGSEGLPVTTDPSGELQREVRFDTDRAWGGTLRKHGYAWGRYAIKMAGILSACMDSQRIFSLSGEDNGWDFIAVQPEIFRGTVHAFPLPESMVLETRQEKQNRLLQIRTAFPEIPPEVFIEMFGYPDLARLTRPGGPAWAMAERENLEIMLGGFPPVLPEHNHEAHLLNHKRRQQTVEYRNAPPNVQAAMRAHVQLHEIFGQQEAIRQTNLQAPVAMAQASVAGSAAAIGGGGGAGPSNGNGNGNGNGKKKAPSGADLESGRAAPGEADPRETATLRT
jgi:hypothetical protein